MLAAANITNRLSVDVQSVEALRMKAASGDPAALKAAVRQFEAMMVQTMLKTVRDSSLAGDGDVFGNSSSMKLYQELMDQQWAQNIVAGRGLGLADMLLKRLSQDADGAAGADGKKTVADKVLRSGRMAPAVPVATHAETVSSASTTTRRDAGGGDEDGARREPGEQPGSDRNSDRKRQFVAAMLPYAQAAERVTGVPARFVVAHAALESGWGRSEIVSGDGKASHNLFGIKADNTWDGDTVRAVTTEYRQGQAMRVPARFRAYADYAAAFVDYARLLKRRYRTAVAAGADAVAFATGLAGSGYATDPGYANKLERTIRSVMSVEA